MGKGEEAMCSEYRMCQSKWVLSVHLGAANHAGQMMVKVVFIIFHLKVCNVYKAMNHAVLSWGRTVRWQTQSPKVISECLKDCTCVSQVLRRVQISLRKISSNFPFSLSHKLLSHPQLFSLLLFWAISSAPSLGCFYFSLRTLSGSLSSLTQLCLPLFLPPHRHCSLFVLWWFSITNAQSITFFSHLFSEDEGGEEAAQSQNLL